MPDNPPLTRGESPEPVVGYDKQEHLAGNWHDDDAIALDQYFEAQDVGPERYDGLQIPSNQIRQTSRLLVARFKFTAFTPQAILALPADPNRENLTVMAWVPFGSGGTSTALFSSEYFSINSNNDPNFNPNNCLTLPVAAALGQTQMFLDKYTGPIFVGALINDTIQIQVIAVTK